MKISKIKPETVVFMVTKVDSNILNAKRTGRIKTVRIVSVFVKEVNEEGGWVLASINSPSSPDRKFYQSDYSKWKAQKPETVTLNFGIVALAPKQKKEHI